MLKWLDTKSAVEYANAIAEKAARIIPLEAAKGKETALGKKAVKLEKLLNQLRGSESHRFNFYQKAKFGTVLKWNLHERGYSKDFIDELVRLALTRLK